MNARPQIKRGNLVVADARKVSPSNFLAALRAAPDPLDDLCGKLFLAARDGDREKCAEIRAEIQSLNTEPLSELLPENRERWVA